MVQNFISQLPFTLKKPILACGADTKGSFALAKGRKAYISLGYEDLGDVASFKKYKNNIKQHLRKFRIKPDIIACDSHPGYFSTGFAKSLGISSKPYPKILFIQHHKAHVASAVIENRIKDKVLGVSFDGTGYGEDGNIWGGEFFRGNLKTLDRIAHLEYVGMPGGESAVKNPWMMAISYLYRALGKNTRSTRLPFMNKIKREDLNLVIEMLKKDFNSPKTSSMGRLFDAVSSLSGLIYKSSFEAEAPIKLEKKATNNTEDSYRFSVEKKYPYEIKVCDMIKSIIKDISSGKEVSYVSTKFHNTISQIILKICKKAKVNKVVLSGGVFMNNVLTEKTLHLLRENGFKVFRQKGIGTTDLGIPLGQIAIASRY